MVVANVFVIFSIDELFIIQTFITPFGWVAVCVCESKGHNSMRTYQFFLSVTLL